jgi:NAD(P)-dependent dehydrogenase (short-subunit alcohol dehydrogenase family)
MTDDELRGKVVLVTGAGSGLGEATGAPWRSAAT